MRKNFSAVICPICDEGQFEPFDDDVFTFRHGGKQYSVPHLNYAKCNVCGTSGYLPGQRKLNSELISEFQAELVDYISPSEVLAVRERYSLTQRQASQIFRGGENGFSKWERGVVSPSGPTAMLIKVALRSAEAMRNLAKIARVDFPIIDNANQQEGIHLVSDASEKPPHPRDKVIIVCTHMEYSDESDIDEENEKITPWKSEKTTTRTLDFSSLN